MEAQFHYLVNIATEYHQYSESPEILFNSVNSLPENVLEEVYVEYGDTEVFQPVNLLRAEIARRLLRKDKIDAAVIESIKAQIENRDEQAFEHLPEDFRQKIADYPIKARGMFVNWGHNFRILFPFFYRGEVKDTSRLYIEQIGAQVLKELNIADYTYVTFDFWGPNNYGGDRAWLALYPVTKTSHKDAYQFFFDFIKSPRAGRVAGHNLKNAEQNIFNPVNSYNDALAVFADLKANIIDLNEKTRNYFKYSPGSQASEWDRFAEDNMVALSFDHLAVGDLSQYETRESLNIAAGYDENNDNNTIRNLWMFKTANIGDLVFVSKGRDICLGIGIMDGSYYYDPNDPEYSHRRPVKWLTKEVYQYKPDGNKHLFRMDTFSPVSKWDFILKEYVRTYPYLASVFEQYKIECPEIKPINEPLLSEQDNANEVVVSDADESAVPNHWWINANPTVWKINSTEVGEKQTYTTHNEKGNKRRVYKYFEAVKPGDLMIGYESTPTKQIKALLEITKGIHVTQEEGESIEFELTEKLEFPVHWNELKNNPSLKNCEVFINNQGSLFKLAKDEYDVICDIIDEKNIAANKQESTPIKKYKFEEDLDKPFISPESFRQAVSLLKRKKNIILQGPPGVGKTFIAKKLAYELMGEKNDMNIETVQFHQSYSYEDFIQGLRPTKNGIDLRDGIFYTFCRRAEAHPGRKFVFIIDEINRGNLSKIFGELMMLLEADKRNQDYKIKLAYAEDEEDRFYVPENLYIIGTMNTADRSLAIVDYALRRRFAFISLQPDMNSRFRAFLSNDLGVSDSLVDHICYVINSLNQRIKDDHNLGEGFQIGHSYFCSSKPGEDQESWWKEIIDFELKPLLEEIWFDDLEKVDSEVKALYR